MADEELEGNESENENEGQAQGVAALLQPVARWRATAESAGPQGADGVGELARTAFRNLQAAPWEYDADPASMPVHEYDRPRPSGQAYKAVWGYDAAARTQRSCCGAACYTYRIPDDAADAGNPEGVATISKVTVELAVDRYCDQGVQIYAALTDDIAPPRPGAVLAPASSGAVWLATANQRGGDGEAIAPNRRAGEAGQATYAFETPAAPRRYLHVILILADYLGVRGAWIEGGAMFAAEGAAVEFSRAVSGDGAAETVAETALVLGRMDYGSGGTTPAAAMAKVPRLQCWINWTFNASRDSAGKLADTSWDTVAQNILAFIYNAPELYAATPSVLGSSGVSVEALGRAAMLYGDSSMGVTFCALAAHGLTGNRVFRGIRFGRPLNPAGGASIIPYRVMAFGIRDLVCFGSSPKSATPLPWWGDIVSEAGRAGRLASLRCLSDPVSAATGANVNITQQQAGDCTAVAVEPLAAVDVGGETSVIPFAKPWQSGELSSVIVALVPNGVPAASDQSAAFDATLSRTVSVTLPNSGACAATRTEIYSNASISSPYNTLSVSLSPYATGTGGYQTPIQGADEGAMIWLHSQGLTPDPGKAVSASGTAYTWADYNYRRKTLDSRLVFHLCGNATVNGVAYNFDEYWIQVLPVTYNVTPHKIPGLASGTEEATYSAFYSGFTRPVTGVAANGSTKRFWATIPAGNLNANASLTAYRVFEAGIGDNDFVGQNYHGAVQASYISGYAYAWADTSPGSVTGTMAVSGTASFVRDGITYTANLGTETSQAALQLAGKGTAPVAGGNDTTTTATISGTLPAFSRRAEFTGANGLKVWATVSAPAQGWSSSGAEWGGVRHITAKSTFNGLAQPAADRTAHDTGQTASVSEAGAQQEIDLGLVSLYE